MPVTSIELAEKIARELFTAFNEEIGDQLMIMRGERNIAAWGFEPAIEAIQKVIEENS